MTVDTLVEEGMTVGELINRLSYFDKDARVVYQYPSGDFWHTQLASVVAEVSEKSIEYSNYHSNLALFDGQDYNIDDSKVRSVVMIF